MGRVVLGSEGEGPWRSCASSGCCQDSGGHGRELLRNRHVRLDPKLTLSVIHSLNSIIKRRTTDFQMMTWIRKDARHEGMSCRLRSAQHRSNLICLAHPLARPISDYLPHVLSYPFHLHFFHPFSLTVPGMNRSPCCPALVLLESLCRTFSC